MVWLRGIWKDLCLKARRTVAGLKTGPLKIKQGTLWSSQPFRRPKDRLKEPWSVLAWDAIAVQILNKGDIFRNEPSSPYPPDPLLYTLECHFKIHHCHHLPSLAWTSFSLHLGLGYTQLPSNKEGLMVFLLALYCSNLLLQVLVYLR